VKYFSSVTLAAFVAVITPPVESSQLDFTIDSLFLNKGADFQNLQAVNLVL
jgi:hypothetical protein